LRLRFFVSWVAVEGFCVSAVGTSIIHVSTSAFASCACVGFEGFVRAGGAIDAAVAVFERGIGPILSVRVYNIRKTKLC
jgi:hypothetical protein